MFINGSLRNLSKVLIFSLLPFPPLIIFVIACFIILGLSIGGPPFFCIIYPVWIMRSKKLVALGYGLLYLFLPFVGLPAFSIISMVLMCLYYLVLTPTFLFLIIKKWVVSSKSGYTEIERKTAKKTALK